MINTSNTREFPPSKLLEMFLSKPLNFSTAHYLMAELLLWGLRTQSLSRKTIKIKSGDQSLLPALTTQMVRAVRRCHSTKVLTTDPPLTRDMPESSFPLGSQPNSSPVGKMTH